jgi:hypothetical protein
LTKKKYAKTRSYFSRRAHRNKIDVAFARTEEKSLKKSVIFHVVSQKSRGLTSFF